MPRAARARLLPPTFARLIAASTEEQRRLVHRLAARSRWTNSLLCLLPLTLALALLLPLLMPLPPGLRLLACDTLSLFPRDLGSLFRCGSPRCPPRFMADPTQLFVFCSHPLFFLDASNLLGFTRLPTPPARFIVLSGHGMTPRPARSIWALRLVLAMLAAAFARASFLWLDVGGGMFERRLSLPVVCAVSVRATFAERGRRRRRWNRLRYRRVSGESLQIRPQGLLSLLLQ